MTYTHENLSGKTGAELVEIFEKLGGEAPASGKFRTKAQGVERVLHQQMLRAHEATKNLKAPVPQASTEETPRQRLQRRIAVATAARDEVTRRVLVKRLRRLNTREAKARYAQDIVHKRTENGRRARLAAEKARKAA